MPSYKLYYFNGRGRAEPTRLMLAAAGLPYEDIRMEPEQWPEYKKKMPMGQAPVLEVDGRTMISQSIAIARFVAKESGLAGKTNMEQARADMMVDGFVDMVNKMADYVWYEPDEARKAEKKKTFFETTLPEFLGHFEKLLVANNGGNGFFVGDGLTHAEVFFLGLSDDITAEKPDILSPHPKLAALVDRIRKYPGIQEWLAKRPQTPW
ncbi:PREDICTED: LOW QUALITY PROTEIN: S-crystallin SL11-like [Branchiostoma belcheri]|uniref:glutathione transferase n=1 Tax=Branchiostoma belcheri TaxID=7741 RepID=A0A6P4ZEU6_BRABE|nr:PREDICTED: LOW QUALITY PROTEIN: S-crystallin SL11-like [Branchiostoma belcheri]